jgi:sulfite oxidase
VAPADQNRWRQALDLCGARVEWRGKVVTVSDKHEGLVGLGEEPLVAETPAHLLDDDTTPTEKFFARNNGRAPDAPANRDAWEITIDGEVETPLTITLGELKRRFAPVAHRIVLECGGNGRSFFAPPALGNPWTTGGVGCAEWTGVRLADVLDAAGLKPSAAFTGHYGADRDIADPTRPAFSRGVPIAKAMEKEHLIAWEMNGEPLRPIHGAPVRLVIGGWSGSVSAKWLKRIWVRDRIHDGPGMGGTSYRIPIKPIIPGSEPDLDNFRELESMPVRSIITSPASGAKLPAGTREVGLRGAAWAGDQTVARVDISIDYGATWRPTALQPPKNRFDWQRWTAVVRLPSDGYFEIWSRATDSNGVMQPHAAGNWNPQGYGANPIRSVAITVG